MLTDRDIEQSALTVEDYEKEKTDKDLDNADAADATDEASKKPSKASKRTSKSKIRTACSEDAHRAFRPYSWMMVMLGRFPVSSRRASNGTYVYTTSLCTGRGIWFVICSILMFLILIFGTINFAKLVLRGDKFEEFTLYTTKKPGAKYKIVDGKNMTIAQKLVMELRERALYKRHEVALFVIWTSLVLGVVGSLNVIFKQEYLVNYLNFWQMALHNLQIDVSKDLHKYSLITLVVYSLSVIAIALLGIVGFGPTSTGAPTLVAVLVFRFFKPDMLAPPTHDDLDGVHDDLIIYQVLGGAVLLFIFMSSRAYIFMFLFKCRLMQNAFAAWNGRVYAAILRGGEDSQTLEGRTTYQLLFRDHCVLLDLLEGTDKFFSNVIESYFGLQIASICFEMFFLYRVAKDGGKQKDAFLNGYFVREHDWVPAFVILVQSLTLLHIILSGASAVGEEAISGLEVIRRKTMLGRKTNDELYFTLSMYSSYTSYQQLGVTGGGYFFLSKEFIIGIINTVFTYVVIIYQFNPKFDMELPGKTANVDLYSGRKRIGMFQERLEDVPSGHWEEEPPK